MDVIRLNLKPFLVAILALVILKIINPTWSNINWGLSSSIIVLAVLIIMLITFEKREYSLNYLVMIATLSSFAAVGRILFTGIASVQPMTFIVMIAGYTWGCRSGFLVGMVGAFISNLYLGQGPWTPWQMIGWGMCGLLAGLLGKRQRTFKLFSFLILAALGGLFFSAIMNLWHWLAFTFPLTGKTLVAIFATSLAFDIMHAINNIIFTLILAKPFYNVLNRFKKFI